MAINPLTFTNPQAYSSGFDFSPLAKLGDIYREAQDRTNRQNTLSALGGEPTQDAMTLIRSGDPGLVQLGINMRNRLTDQAREDARYAVTDPRAERLLKIQEAAATRAEKDWQENDPKVRRARIIANGGNPDDPRYENYIYRNAEIGSPYAAAQEARAAAREQREQTAFDRDTPEFREKQAIEKFGYDPTAPDAAMRAWIITKQNFPERGSLGAWTFEKDDAGNVYAFNKNTGDYKPLMGQGGVRPTAEPGSLPAIDIDRPLNPKANIFDKTLLENQATQLEALRSRADLATRNETTLNRIEKLHEGAWTGPVIGQYGHYLPGGQANQLLNAETAELTLTDAKDMKGSLSDKDVAFLSRKPPSALMDPAAAKDSISAHRAANERFRQQYDFYSEWQARKGDLRGADAAWKRYVNDNPITKEDKGAVSGRSFNPDYNKDFSRYMYGAKVQQASGQGSGADAIIAKARAAISEGRDPAMVRKRLIDAGIDPSALDEKK